MDISTISKFLLEIIFIRGRDNRTLIPASSKPSLLTVLEPRDSGVIHAILPIKINPTEWESTPYQGIIITIQTKSTYNN